MTLEELKELMTQFDASSLKEMQVKMADFELSFSKNEYAPQFAKEEKTPLPNVIASEKRPEVVVPKEEKATFTPIKAPLIGTFYRKGSPEDENFVEVGQRIEKGDIIGIIEAMKVMNEVPSPVSGILKKIHFENEAPVSYDAILMEVEEA